MNRFCTMVDRQKCIKPIFLAGTAARVLTELETTDIVCPGIEAEPYLWLICMMVWGSCNHNTAVPTISQFCTFLL